jgi:hypothetical protein
LERDWLQVRHCGAPVRAIHESPLRLKIMRALSRLWRENFLQNHRLEDFLRHHQNWRPENRKGNYEAFCGMIRFALTGFVSLCYKL